MSFFLIDILPFAKGVICVLLKSSNCSSSTSSIELTVAYRFLNEFMRSRLLLFIDTFASLRPIEPLCSSEDLFSAFVFIDWIVSLRPIEPPRSSEGLVSALNVYYESIEF